MKFKGFRKIDFYIIQNFLTTYIFAIVLIIGLAVIFDFSEKIDDFVENEAPMSAIIKDYYLNFIPYFAVLFSPLFVFIAVVFFTSKMAYNTEIIAILSSGISFKRLLIPYVFTALLIAVSTFYLTNYVIPKATEKRHAFEEEFYYSSPVNFSETNIHKQLEPGLIIYMESFSTRTNIGYQFSMERFEDGKLTSKLISDFIRWNEEKEKWKIRNYYIRHIKPDTHYVEHGYAMDTTLNMHPDEFKRRANVVEMMTTPELIAFQDKQEMQGAGNVNAILIERHKRTAVPFSTFILTIIGASISSRKIRGGTGMHLGLGLLIAFSYILFLQFSSQFAMGGVISPLIAVWIPNILYSILAFFIYRMGSR